MENENKERELNGIRRELEGEFREWERIYREGAGDPDWPDGILLGLHRMKILHGYQRMLELENGKLAFSLDKQIQLQPPGERPVPPYVRYDYRVK